MSSPEPRIDARQFLTNLFEFQYREVMMVFATLTVVVCSVVFFPGFDSLGKGLQSDVSLVLVGMFVVVAIGAGADRVERVQFGLTAEREAAVREQALTDAMDGARGQANVLASNANLTITGVHTVSTTNVRTIPYRSTGFEAEAAGGASGPATGVEPGDVDVSVTVRVVFAVESS